MYARERIAWFGIPVGCAVLALKAAAWLATGSAALYSDALESIVNVAASVVALVALRIAARPADTDHASPHLVTADSGPPHANQPHSTFSAPHTTTPHPSPNETTASQSTARPDEATAPHRPWPGSNANSIPIQHQNTTAPWERQPPSLGTCTPPRETPHEKLVAKWLYQSLQWHGTGC